MERALQSRLFGSQVNRTGESDAAGFAPYLDYQPVTDSDHELIAPLFQDEWLGSGLDEQALRYAITKLVPEHVQDVRKRRQELIVKTRAAVRDRLTKEIAYWDHRATELRLQEQAGKTPRLNSTRAQQRAEELDRRLTLRMAELDREEQIAPLPPVAIGGALIVPAGLLARMRGERPEERNAAETARIERLAMDAVMDAERALDFRPRDVSAAKLGWDIESVDPRDGHIRLIEVKGRALGAITVIITHNEIVRALNKPGDFILAIVIIDDVAQQPRYVRRPFHTEPDFGVTSVNYDLRDLLMNSQDPT